MGTGTPGRHHHGIKAATPGHQDKYLFRSGERVAITGCLRVACEIRYQSPQFFGVDLTAVVEFFRNALAVQSRGGQQISMVGIQDNNGTATC